ncbi:MAG: stage II sporulation protein M [Oscillospiraceae bacterium]
MMRTSMRHRQYRYRSFDFGRMKMVLREEWKMVTLISLFLSGMIIGAIAAKYNDNEINAKLVTMFSDFTMLRNTQSIFDTFLSSFAVYFIFLFISFTFGLCAIGIPIIAAIPLARGIGLGMVSGFLYSTYALSGAGYCMVILFPSAVISTAALLFGCNESFVMSYELLHLMNGESSYQHENILKKYCARYLILFGIIILAALIDTLMTILFASKFSFV